eukprot:9489328-Pyramimonas_sp.AAC.1
MCYETPRSVCVSCSSEALVCSLPARTVCSRWYSGACVCHLPDRHLQIGVATRPHGDLPPRKAGGSR